MTVYRSHDEHTYLDGGVAAVLDSLPADSARALLHVLDCQTCQDAALAEAFDAVESRDEEKPPIRQEVQALMAELLAFPQEQRLEVLKDPRFQGMELLDRIPDAALASLDLAAHYAETGRVQEIGRLVGELEAADGEPWGTRLGADALRTFLGSKPSCGKGFEKAAVISASLRRSLRLGLPGLQTLPWT